MASGPGFETLSMESIHPSGMPSLAERLYKSVDARSDFISVRDALLVDDLSVALSKCMHTPERCVLTSTVSRDFLKTVEFIKRLRDEDVNLDIAYSIKTNPCIELVKLSQSSGFLAEAISQFEVKHALNQGFRSEQIVLNGPGKWWPSPLNCGPYKVVFCDSLGELRNLVKRTRDPIAEYIGIRVRPFTINSRFGIPIFEETYFQEVVSLLRSLPSHQGIGFQFHVASSSCGIRNWQFLAQDFIGALRYINEQVGHRKMLVSLGGGWHPADWNAALTHSFFGILEEFTAQLKGLQGIVCEPGKALAQQSMCLITKVLEVKRYANENEIIVDGSIAELPDIQSHVHRVLSFAQDGSSLQLWPRGTGRILGRLCMEHDVLAMNIKIPDHLRSGAYVIFLDCGAYDASMSYRFGAGQNLAKW